MAQTLRIAALVVALAALEVAGPVTAQEKIAARVEGRIVRLFEPEQIVELKVDRVPDDVTSVRKGEPIFVRVTRAHIFDVDGTALDRSRPRAWYSKDEGWQRVRCGRAVRAQLRVRLLAEVPEEMERDDHVHGKLLVYEADALWFLDEGR